MAGPGPQTGVSNLKQKTKQNQKQTKQTQGKPTNIVWEPSWPGLAPRLGCARLSGVPKTKNKKKTKTKTTNTRKTNKTKFGNHLGRAWPPDWGVRAAESIILIEPQEKPNKQTKNKQNHKNTVKTNKPKFGNHPGRAGPGQPPGPARMVPKL